MRSIHELFTSPSKVTRPHQLKISEQTGNTPRGHNSFAFSDLRHIIAKAALSKNFNRVCDKHDKSPQKSFVDTLLRMAVE